MTLNRSYRYLLYSLTICLVFALSGALIVNKDLSGMFTHIKNPAFMIPRRGWITIGVLFYIINAIILYRAFYYSNRHAKGMVVILVVLILAYNEFWNYLLFGLHNPVASLTALIPYILLLVFLFITLLEIDKVSPFVLLPYLIWIIYDFLWAAKGWLLNR